MNENQGFHILVVDDELEYQNVFRFILEEQGFVVTTCSSGPEALDMIKREDIQIVLTDLRMPGMSGASLIREIKAYDPAIEIMVVTAFGSIESAVETMKEGAFGYFIKSNSPEELLADIEKIIKIKRLESDNDILRQQSRPSDVFLETKNEAFAQILNDCVKTADSNINVLLLGESGVGKEVVAKYIHDVSARSSKHFIAVNCQVFSEGMIESELFGHEKGAFTGATEKRIGRFEEANYGTLFLDEIGELSNNTQIKLLRALETRSIERIGSNKRVDLDIRLICATNQDLSKATARGLFREDLLYRINTLTMTIPPLRERKEDLPGLISFFSQRIQQELKKKINTIDDEVSDFLLRYDYPGNVRELKNIMERLIALSDGGRIRASEISQHFNLKMKEHGDFRDGVTVSERSLRDVRAEAEASYIKALLSMKGFDLDETARVLDITKRQLWNKIGEYQLKDFIHQGKGER